jgi:hypothetical protein
MYIITLNDDATVKEGLGRTWREAVVVYLKDYPNNSRID